MTVVAPSFHRFIGVLDWYLIVLVCVSSINCNPKCLLVNDRYECRDVQSMQQILSVGMQSNWTRIAILNNPNSTFTNAVHNNQLLRNVVELDLSTAGKLMFSDRGFNVFDDLTTLNISYGQLRTLHDSWFSAYNRITHLNASHNSLMLINRETVKALRSLLQLAMLDLSYNDIDYYPANCFDNLGLTELIIRYNGMQCLAPFGRLPRLIKLDLNDNSLKQIQSNIFQGLSALQILDLSLNQINELQPNCFNGLEATLETLDLSQNSIKNLPTPLLPDFNHLQNLDLHDNILRHFQTNLFINLSELKKLDISQNDLKALNTTTFDGLHSLRTLLLHHNNIQTIQSNTFAQLENLYELNLSNNSLRTLSGQYFGDTLPNLKRFFVKWNLLNSLHPSSFQYLPQLDFLVLAYNELTTLPADVFNSVKNLRKLHLYKNRIENLEGDLFNHLNGLRELYLSHNRLSFFPNVSVEFNLLERAALEGNPWQCACFDELSEFLQTGNSNVDLRIKDNPFYTGEKPLCVVTDDHCVKDIQEVKRRNFLAIYDEAFRKKS